MNAVIVGELGIGNMGDQFTGTEHAVLSLTPYGTIRTVRACLLALFIESELVRALIFRSYSVIIGSYVSIAALIGILLRASYIFGGDPHARNWRAQPRWELLS